MTGCNAAMPADTPMPEKPAQSEETTVSDEEPITEGISAEAQAEGTAVDPEEFRLTGIDSNTVFFIRTGSEQSSIAENTISDEEVAEIKEMINNAPKTEGNVNGTENMWFKNGDISVYISTEGEGYASIHGAKDVYVPLDGAQCERLKAIVEGSN